MEGSLCKIHSDSVQLPVCQYGIWNYDGRSRFSLVLFSAGQSVRVYRSLSVCACDAAFRRSIVSDHCVDCIFDEQPSEFLCPDLCG